MSVRNKLIDNSGNIVVIVALLLPVILLSLGAGIDIVNSYRNKSKLQDSVDIAALATAKEMSLIGGSDKSSKSMASSFPEQNRPFRP